eukprot:TRINITY_DN5174_c0_g1_i1.p1 TRINITY_DN5174_c0_g1~~TRINITY_DN5174_c0_g1_i1.p1  ORF type:complete len:611 (-),score=156.20 TRINITY_DN5174_c0_g1_i1:74-1879(-)
MGSTASQVKSSGPQWSCSCRCSGGKAQPHLGRTASDIEGEGVRRVNSSSFPVKKKDFEEKPSVARAALAAAELRCAEKPSLPAECLEPGSPISVGLACGADGSSCEESSDGGAGVVASKSSRTPKRRDRRRLTVTQTMGVSPSSALQIVINNPGKLEAFYEIDRGKPLGQGSFGVVRRAFVRSTRAVRAAKYISMELMKTKLDVLKQEIEIMKAVDHPNAVMLYEIFDDDKYLYLVMEICSGGSLYSRVKSAGSFNEDQAALAMRQILRGVFYLHRNLICHRDLKAENILVSSPDSLTKSLLKISDFGLSCTFRPKQVFTGKVGTLTHMSPEVLDKRYDHACDVWACGVILYFLLCGSVPWRDETEIRASRLPFAGKHWWDASQDVVAFVRRLLSRAANRPSAPRALQDVWFQKHLCPEEPDLRYTLLDDLRNYRALNKFKRAALSTVASMLREEQIAASRDIFVALDTDGDGLLSVSEVEERLRKMHESGKVEKALGRREVERIFRDMDSSGGSLKDFSYTEFLAATFNRKLHLTDAVLREAFNTFDKSGDGTVDLSELANGRLLGHIPIEELQKTLEELDQNGDSVIDFAEFVDMMRQN